MHKTIQCSNRIWLIHWLVFHSTILLFNHSKCVFYISCYFCPFFNQSFFRWKMKILLVFVLFFGTNHAYIPSIESSIYPTVENRQKVIHNVAKFRNGESFLFVLNIRCILRYFTITKKISYYSQHRQRFNWAWNGHQS